jgi:hypothetical protein
MSSKEAKPQRESRCSAATTPTAKTKISFFGFYSRGESTAVF